MYPNPAYLAFFEWLRAIHNITALYAGLDAVPDHEFSSQYLFLILATEGDELSQISPLSIADKLAEKYAEQEPSSP